jgi:hypothetical protein
VFVRLVEIMVVAVRPLVNVAMRLTLAFGLMVVVKAAGIEHPAADAAQAEREQSDRPATPATLLDAPRRQALRLRLHGTTRCLMIADRIGLCREPSAETIGLKSDGLASWRAPGQA